MKSHRWAELWTDVGEWWEPPGSHRLSCRLRLMSRWPRVLSENRSAWFCVFCLMFGTTSSWSQPDKGAENHLEHLEKIVKRKTECLTCDLAQLLRFEYFPRWWLKNHFTPKYLLKIEFLMKIDQPQYLTAISGGMERVWYFVGRETLVCMGTVLRFIGIQILPVGLRLSLELNLLILLWIPIYL